MNEQGENLEGSPERHPKGFPQGSRARRRRRRRGPHKGKPAGFAGPRPLGHPWSAGGRGALHEPRRQSWLALLVLLLVAGALLTASVLIFLPFLATLVLATVFATVTYPFFERILRWIGGKRRGLAAFVSCLALVFLVFCPLGGLSWNLAVEARSAIPAAAAGLEDVMGRLETTW